MFPMAMSNSASLSTEEAIISSVTRFQDFGDLNPMVQSNSSQQPQQIRKDRSLPGNPDPDAEVIALSPKTLLATNIFVCEVCNKEFQRDQNLQLHRRGHNLPWKLKQRNSKENKKRAYVCPEKTCVHHQPSRALCDLSGIKKHYCRKHGVKKWKCEKCEKIYAVQSDWKAHTKTCGTREYTCDCGTFFSRKDSFVTHRAFCDALAEESARLSANPVPLAPPSTTIKPKLFHPNSQNPSSFDPFQVQQHQQQLHYFNPPTHVSLNLPWDIPETQAPSPNPNQNQLHIKPEYIHIPFYSPCQLPPTPTHKRSIPSPFQSFTDSIVHPAPNTVHHLSATALLQKAAALGALSVGHVNSTMTPLVMSKPFGPVANRNPPPEYPSFTPGNLGGGWEKNDQQTRDFSGLKPNNFGFANAAASETRGNY